MNRSKNGLITLSLIITCCSGLTAHGKKFDAERKNGTLVPKIHKNFEFEESKSYDHHISDHRGCFYLTYDSMEVQINQMLKESALFDSKNDMHKMASGVMIKVRKNGKIKKIVWIENPKPNRPIEKTHQQLISEYLMTLRWTRNAYVNKDGKKVILREIPFQFMIDDCGYIKLFDSNSFKDQDINLLDCPFVL